jgi:hypothetical protein
MKINILCQEEHLKEVREKMPYVSGLNIKLSESGSLPSTHRFCTMIVTEEKFNELMSLKDKTIMEEGRTKEFLKKWNLQIISRP